MVWNEMEYGMERKFRYGIGKMPEWNGMEDFENGIEGSLSYFHTNSILDFVHCIYRKIHTDVGSRYCHKSIQLQYLRIHRKKNRLSLGQKITIFNPNFG